MSRTSRAALALLLTSAAVAPASAQIYYFNGTLSGLQEVPPTPSAGTGFVAVTFDDAANTLFIDSFFSGLSFDTSAAHIHLGSPTGGVATQTPSFTGFPLDIREGTFSNTYDLTLASSYNPSFLNNATNMGNPLLAEASLLNGLLGGIAYFNIHTDGFPGGEIRANLTAAPEPATWMMMVGGFGAVGLMIRRRKKALRAIA